MGKRAPTPPVPAPGKTAPPLQEGMQGISGHLPAGLVRGACHGQKQRWGWGRLLACGHRWIGLRVLQTPSLETKPAPAGRACPPAEGLQGVAGGTCSRGRWAQASTWHSSSWSLGKCLSVLPVLGAGAPAVRRRLGCSFWGAGGAQREEEGGGGRQCSSAHSTQARLAPPQPAAQEQAQPLGGLVCRAQGRPRSSAGGDVAGAWGLQPFRPLPTSEGAFSLSLSLSLDWGWAAVGLGGGLLGPPLWSAACLGSHMQRPTYGQGPGWGRLVPGCLWLQAGV